MLLLLLLLPLILLIIAMESVPALFLSALLHASDLSAAVIPKGKLLVGHTGAEVGVGMQSTAKCLAPIATGDSWQGKESPSYIEAVVLIEIFGELN